jgi:hypothetical protein
MNVRRLEAESIRDSLLAVSGTLDPKMGGSLLHVRNREFFFDHTSRDGTKYDSRQRSVYLPVVRNNLYDVFQLFDFTDATVMNGDRATSTVASQALFWMNSDLVVDAADTLATRVLTSSAPSNAEGVQSLYLTLFGRPATAVEIDRDLRFIAEFTATENAAATGAGQEAWAALCRVLLASNEFVFVR